MIATFLSALRMATSAIVRNKLRTALTMLGILIGVAAVVVTTAIGTGARGKINDQIAGLGSNLMVVFPQANQASGARGAQGQAARLTEADAKALVHGATSIAEAAPYLRSIAQLVYEDRNVSTQVIGTTRGYFTKLSQTEKGPLAADMRAIVGTKPDPAAIERMSALPHYNAQIRTTCVPTRLEAGHADNALPQIARAMVNCRILPGHTADEVQQTLEKVLADPKLAITRTGKEIPGKPSPLDKELFAAVEKLTAKYWPGTPVVPMMSTGATDGKFLRNIGIPCYGHSGLASDIADVRAHGKDERVNIKAFAEEQQYLYELVKLLAGGR